MQRRWRCPPDTFVPPCEIGISRSSTKVACAISSARHSCSSVASGLATRKFDATVPENKYGFCGTIATAPTSCARRNDATSRPPTSTRPPVGAYRRGINPNNVDLPEPVEPIIAVVSPGLAWKEMPSSTGSSAPGYVKVTSSKVTVLFVGAAALAGGSISDGSCFNTSVIRVAHTRARGSIIAMNAPIITAARICRRYCKNAVNDPTCTSPASTRWPPNQRTAAVARFRISMITGNIITNKLPIRRLNRVRSALAASKRSDSNSSRVNARTTRTPAICSRSTPLIRSIFDCIVRNNGSNRPISAATTTANTTTETATSQLMPGSSRTAMTTPPTIMIGTATIKFKNIRNTCWTCCTSFVPRVISVAEPKCDMSSAEKRDTRPNTSSRISRPVPIEALDPNQTAAHAAITCTNATASITPPVRQMKGTSPWETPSSIIFAFKLGR